MPLFSYAFPGNWLLWMARCHATDDKWRMLWASNAIIFVLN